jgi:hypothetical protein
MMRKRQKPAKPAPVPQRETNVTDNTPAIAFLESELARLIHKVAALPRAVVIKVLLEHADGLCQLAVESDDDLSVIEGLLQ